MSDSESTSAVVMQLTITLPNEELIRGEFVKLTAHATNGAFCLLPRHIDVVTAIVPCVVCLTRKDQSEVFVAVDEGILVKYGKEVLLSTPNGVTGADLSCLTELIAQRTAELDEHERRARKALARLEAATLRQFKEFQDLSYGLPG